MIKTNKLSYLAGSIAAGILLFTTSISLADEQSKVVPLLDRVIFDSNKPIFQEGINIAPIARATIFVRDIDESLKLYRDILGMKPMFDNYWSGEGINAIMGTKDKELRATVLMAGKSIQGNLGIYQLYNETGLPPRSIQSTDTRTGDFAIVFPTNDIYRLTEEIRSAGYPIISPPVSLIYRDEYEIQPVEMMFRDPDGVLVNLVQAGKLK